MKKNPVAHMLAPREPIGGRLRRLDLWPRFLCLLLALLLWLVIVNVSGTTDAADATASQMQVETSVETL